MLLRLLIDDVYALYIYLNIQRVSDPWSSMELRGSCSVSVGSVWRKSIVCSHRIDISPSSITSSQDRLVSIPHISIRIFIRRCIRYDFTAQHRTSRKSPVYSNPSGGISSVG